LTFSYKFSIFEELGDRFFHDIYKNSIGDSIAYNRFC